MGKNFAHNLKKTKRCNFVDVFISIKIYSRKIFLEKIIRGKSFWKIALLFPLAKQLHRGTIYYTMQHRCISLEQLINPAELAISFSNICSTLKMLHSSVLICMDSQFFITNSILPLHKYTVQIYYEKQGVHIANMHSTFIFSSD